MTTITLTFGDCAENHVGMEKITADDDVGGLNVEYLKNKEKEIKNCEYYDLSELIQEDVSDAGVLVIRKGVDWLLKKRNLSSDDLLKEQMNLQWDSKAYMYGRVVNKHARYNLCFADVAHEPDYEQKKGRVVAFEDVPITNYLRRRIRKKFGLNLVAEGNLYYDVKKCGIGYHGDSERKIVIGCRFGKEMPLHFTWFRQSKSCGKTLKLLLNHGDLYIMSEKAVGQDWKKKNIFTLRHSAGCDKFTKIEN